MENAALLTLAGLCLGIALSGLLATALRRGGLRDRLSLALVYLAFIGMVAWPLVETFAAPALMAYMPVLLVLLLALPPAFHHHIVARTALTAASPLPKRDLILPALGILVCIGFWILPAQTRRAMFIAGDLPAGFLPAALALATFTLIIIWLIASFAYLVASLRRLAAFRAHIRQLYSDAPARDLRWVDVVMVLLVLIWAAGAFSLADQNFANGGTFAEELFLTLIAAGLAVLNLFAPITTPQTSPDAEEPVPDLKYARSALTSARAQQLAERLEAAMGTDKLYLDPALSLQKLSKHVRALPNQVSQTLNQEIGVSFFDYVSRWRIEASKPLIATGELSVLTVALDVGFNSRSAFYNAFKRETGLTPKGYRAQQKDAA